MRSRYRAPAGRRLSLIFSLLFGSLLFPILADAEEFNHWLQGLRRDAAAAGISSQTLDETLGGIQPLAFVLRAQQRQPETTLTWEQYRKRVVSFDRQLRGRELAAEHADELRKVADQYGVQARFIVAFWGIESDYGRNLGDVPVAAALATIAHGGRRQAYFRRELLELLRSIDAGHTPPGTVTGSWAGALGQCQFMPSNYRRHAVDGDGDGRRDIWGNKSDIFASIANFLAKLGWNDEQTWGRAVRIPADFDPRLAGLDVRMKLARWQDLGVRRLDGRNLPRRKDLWSNLLLPDGRSGEAFLVYDDFHTTMRWNRSTHFALAVGILADAIAPALK
ncbi:MAG: lytic murein transglycosylase [Gemmatimonadetes bacterium]|jgi:membrane-bound lytic murein transglycosylase B|nr:lytic murein transglycosylase [Gemmatimonadota bacterium]MBT6146979.1 lytic murein transglycosylase [Gemmatimonadota bacterium]MBT7858663.1 lytic murein transglycosylase [Gemmatimonadota bacterium]